MRYTTNRFPYFVMLAALFLLANISPRSANAQATNVGSLDAQALPDALDITAPEVASLGDGMLAQSAPQQTKPQQPSAQNQNPAQNPDQNPDKNPASPDAPGSTETKSANGTNVEEQTDKTKCKLLPCATPIIDWYKRFEDGPQVKPLTPNEKAWLATKNLIDPFNILTILGEAGISVGANSHSAYGPGMPGYGRYVGVSFTQDLTGQFFGTFLIPSLAHQDPHYHREPNATIFHRSLHVVTQVVWTQGDNGKGMLNYANLAGFAIEDGIGNLYVPGQRTNASATAQRYLVGLATAPIDNIITEFLPDVAKRIHIQVVVVQRIVNHIANNNSTGS